MNRAAGFTFASAMRNFLRRHGKRPRNLGARASMFFLNATDPATIKETKVTFGATVTMNDVDNDTKVVYHIVGEDESDASSGKISISAPIARAMLGKKVGDEVIVKLPKGDREYEVVRVEYKAIP